MAMEDFEERYPAGNLPPEAGLGCSDECCVPDDSRLTLTAADSARLELEPPLETMPTDVDPDALAYLDTEFWGVSAELSEQSRLAGVRYAAFGPGHYLEVMRRASEYAGGGTISLGHIEEAFLEVLAAYRRSWGVESVLQMTA